MSRLCLFLGDKWQIQEKGRGGTPPLYLDQNEAPPLSEGLDPPLETHLFWIVTIKT